MFPPNTCTNPCRGILSRAAAWAMLLGALAGCQVPPAQPETGATGHGNWCRGVVLTRQLVADTAVQTATSPLTSSAQAAGDAGAILVRAGQELVCKRLVLALAGQPGPLD